MAKDYLHPKLRNSLLRGDAPAPVDLQGPGPFQLPLLLRVESILEGPPLELRLETESGQEVRVHLTAEAAEVLRSSLVVLKKRREGASGE